jgi:hypothetical protein
MHRCTNAHSALGLCSDTRPERPGQTEQHPSDTEQRLWTGYIVPLYEVGQTEPGEITKNCEMLHICTSMQRVVTIISEVVCLIKCTTAITCIIYNICVV